MKRVHKFIVILCCVVLTASCAKGSHELFTPSKPDLIDPALDLDRNDYRNISDPKEANKTGPDGTLTATPATGEPPVPELAEILAAPEPPKLGETQLVSIAVTDDVPLKDVLIELARLANVDIEVDAGITGGVSFRAKDRPFNEVIDRLSDLAGLRYSMKNNMLRVERDTPYVQIYSLDFLNLERSSQSSVNISTSVLSSSGTAGGGSSGGGGAAGGGGGGGGGGLSNGSSASVTEKADSDFWKQFEASIKRILTYKDVRRVSDISIAEQPGAPAAVVQPAGAPAPGGAPGAGGAAAVVPAPVSVPGESNDMATTANGEPVPGAFYIINREASTMTVSATERQHELIQRFMRKLLANASAQVLIEAKIVEVTLSDKFQSGIDWTKLGANKLDFTSNFGAVSDKGNIATFNLAVGNDLAGVVQLADAFGTTRTLSSPRLHAINNQQAVLTFAQNFVYFSINAQQSQSAAAAGATTGINTLTVNSTPHTVPIGIIMSLQPSINIDTQEVTLSVRPTLSRIVDSVNDPAVAFSLAQAKASGADVTGITSAVPIIEVRELDSILKLKSGQVMVIGGMMEDSSTNKDAGVPGVSSVPMFGNLFKGISKDNEVSELVIFIRATIVDSAPSVDPTDQNVYHKFTKDPRPLNF